MEGEGRGAGAGGPDVDRHQRFRHGVSADQLVGGHLAFLQRDERAVQGAGE